MSENTQTTGDSAAALAATASGSCCASPTRAVESALPPVVETATAGPCCGTAEAARAADSCCDAEAKAEAINAGRKCCR